MACQGAGGSMACQGVWGAERVDSPVRPDIARSHCAVAAAYAARCSAPAAAAV